MPRYIVALTEEERQELQSLIQKGGKGYRIKHAQLLLKLDQKPENKAWTYDRIKDAYGTSHNTIAYDPLCPVVCIDETNKQLIEETRIPCEPDCVKIRWQLKTHDARIKLARLYPTLV